MLYTLMHRDVKVMDLELDEYSNITSLGQIYHKEHLPLGTYNKIGVDRNALNRWWTKRSIPASRKGIRDVLYELNIFSPQELIKKCFGLSLSDQYWISPENAPLDWHKVNFFDNAFSEDIGDILFGKRTNSDSASFVSPDNTANGNLKKKWKIINGKRVLIKDSSNPYRQEAYNEVLAAEMARRLGISHTPYTLTEEHGEIYSCCEDFVTSETELVSAAQVVSAFKKPNDQSEYEFYIDSCEKLGIANIREEAEKMLVLDYLIANEDRHLNNFGLIRNAVTLEWIGTAPLYDNGNSLWFNRLVTEIRADDDSNIKTPLWKKNPSRNLELVTDFSWIDFSALDGMEEYAQWLYSQSPYMEQSRVNAIAKAVQTRIDILNEIVQTQFDETSDKPFNEQTML